MIHFMPTLLALLTTAVLFLTKLYFNPRFFGLMLCPVPGMFGWSEGDLYWQKVWWFGFVGFVWRK